MNNNEKILIGNRIRYEQYYSVKYLILTLLLGPILGPVISKQEFTRKYPIDLIYLQYDFILIGKKRKRIALADIEKIEVEFIYKPRSSSQNGTLTFVMKTGKRHKQKYLSVVYGTLLEIFWQMDNLKLNHPTLIYTGSLRGHKQEITDLADLEKNIDEMDEKPKELSYFNPPSEPRKSQNRFKTDDALLHEREKN